MPLVELVLTSQTVKLPRPCAARGSCFLQLYSRGTEDTPLEVPPIPRERFPQYLQRGFPDTRLGLQRQPVDRGLEEGQAG